MITVAPNPMVVVSPEAKYLPVEDSARHDTGLV
jgi:hypothetical protein